MGSGQRAAPTLFVGTTDSLGERVQKLLPDARVIKAFNTVDASHFFRPQIPGGPPHMFLAGNDFRARDAVAGICQEFGWGTAYLGGIECARFLEPMALAWAAYALMTGATGHAFKLLGKAAKRAIPREEATGRGARRDRERPALERVTRLGTLTHASDCNDREAGWARRWARPRPPGQTYPRSTALRTARVRSRTPSLARMFDTWFFTVPSATKRARPISRLE